MILLQKDIENISYNLKDIHDKLNGINILIAGGLGFLGKYFIDVISYLNKNENLNIKLYVIDNFITSNTNITKKFISEISDTNIIINQKDIIKFEEFFELDLVINAAGIASPYYYRKYPLETVDVNIDGTKNLLKLSLQNKCKFIFFSSSEIYGNPDSKNIPTPEDYNGNVSSIGPRSCYDESKRMGETLSYIYNKKFGLDINIVRPFNVFGPGMSKFDYRIMPNFINNIIQDIPVNIYSDGKQTRTYCYISDAIEGFFRVFCNGQSGEAYNIGSDIQEISVLELLEIMEKSIDRKIKYKIIDYPSDYPSDEPLRRCPDLSKSKSHLNYFPKISLEKGINSFYNWAVDNYAYEK